MKQQQNDFARGSIPSNIMRLAIPMIFAQLINVLYNIVDRMYIGHIPEAAANALTGLGITFPILCIVTAFANLFGGGGAPLFSIAWGKGDRQSAEEIMGNSFALLLGTGVLLTAVILLFKQPLLYLFGASEVTFPYADQYLTIYICGSIFVMAGLGMNNFINAQGFARVGMGTVLIGAVLNLILDPIFIFIFDMGVSGAALATVLSQLVSSIWAVAFLAGKRVPMRLRLCNLRVRLCLFKRISALGFSGFIMSVTNSGVQIVCNATLQAFGGDLYVGVMTIINSVREIASVPVNGLTSAAQPVMGYNYGAKEYRRVRSGIKFTSITGFILLAAIWIFLLAFPEFFISIFNDDPALVSATIPAIHLYFFGFFMMALQMAGQSAAVSLGKSKQAVFFSLLRKAFIVIPLTLILPNFMNLGVNGVFLAEPISNFIGGGACFITMLCTIWRELKQKEQQEPSSIV